MKTITILLTKYSDLTSNIVYFLAGGGYTHVSLALCEDEDTYYSFNYRGFCLESIEKHRRKGVKSSISYQILVSEKEYKKIKKQIAEFKENKEKYRYTKLGVFFCTMRIPYKRKNKYFCSQFVAETLEKAKALPLKRHPSLYFPNHFLEELEQCGRLIKVQPNRV